MLLGDTASRVDVLKNWKWKAENAGKYKVARWIPEEKGEILAQIVSETKPMTYFESGTANGYSTLYAAVALPPEGIVHTFDPANRMKIWGDFPEWKDVTERITYHHSKFNPKPDDIEDLTPYWPGVLKVLPAIGPKAFFIDGDHSYTGVTQDWDAIKNFLKEKDIVIFDDIAGERRTLKAFLNILANIPHFITHYEVERRWFTTRNREKGTKRNDCLGIIRILRTEDILPQKKEVIRGVHYK